MHVARNSLGFSLIELMVAMVAGLVVIGSVVVFTIGTAQSNSATVSATRLMQEMRGAMNIIAREVRRSGYNQTAVTFVASGNPVNGYNSNVIRSASCVVVRYDRVGVGTDGTPATGEFHGFRLAQKNGIGVVQASLATAADPNCAAAANANGWIDVTNPQLVNITQLSFVPATGAGGRVLANGFCVGVQEIQVGMLGSLVREHLPGTTSRSIQETIRVRNDMLTTVPPAGC